MSRMSSLEKENMIYEICANGCDLECIDRKYWKYIERHHIHENFAEFYKLHSQDFITLREKHRYSID